MQVNTPADRGHPLTFGSFWGKEGVVASQGLLGSLG
jgi:hypothetical protein